MSANDNHRSWAKHYDAVNRMCFGRFYDELTRQTLAQINTLGSNLRIADFGAGTGRLSLPLASTGHSVTAIEPSQAMLEQLAAKDTAGQISKHNSTIAGYTGPGGHDLAIAVFTVIAYITTEQELVDSFRKVAETIKPGGAFLLDIPRQVLFSDNYVEKVGLVRDITFTQTSLNHYTYQEKTRLDTADGVFTYEDTFPLRYWTTTEVEKALHEAGLKRTKDWSHHFPMAGAEYWLYSREVEVSYSSRAVTV
jgi:2-polyprenyl-3-methyl-5-hydroxy-6-metoxy-1,4-benzoquinol methylase